ncbi:hypothetical protein HMJ29_06900 [Hymenobacter taeanensis]|uniref:DUF6799 domain-containing protein n=1 Tax=Hymenobacter taeanensis TaxID=2735321 RepID=A0A6M6BDT9_9BACT|nr:MULTISPECIES: DUF6799 domain-containing protein [Hymenobacter]QJX46681.1 hypothetical protein HMJ29_06900 [Hymenobacter taeanensis]UOQ80546.1 hypothetical protein MUN83_17245 [Hymenobacter sp. 5414T-23]
MKQYSILAVAAVLCATSLSTQAQTSMPARRAVQPKQKVVIKGATMKDGFLMKDGKVLMTRDAHTDALTSETTLVNGTKIGADGTVTMADGTTSTLKEGDYVSLTGRLTSASYKAQQDSLVQAQMAGGKGKVKSKKKVK